MSETDGTAYPMDAPIISGLKTHYHAGEFIEAQCTAPPSYPAPEMTWSINGQGVDNFKTNLRVHDDRGLLRATLSVKLMAEARLFSNVGGYALFLCTSALMDTPPMTAEAKVYWSTEPSPTETNSELNDGSSGIFRNSDEDNSLKEEPPDGFGSNGIDQDDLKQDRDSINVFEPKPTPKQRQASGGSLTGSKKRMHLVTFYLSAVAFVCSYRNIIQLTT